MDDLRKRTADESKMYDELCKTNSLLQRILDTMEQKMKISLSVPDGDAGNLVIEHDDRGREDSSAIRENSGVF